MTARRDDCRNALPFGLRSGRFRTDGGNRRAHLLIAASLFLSAAAARGDGLIPAPPLLTLYEFNGPPALPYYEVARFLTGGPSSPAGTLALGSSVVPCLVIRDGKPVTDAQGTPYVGFEVVIDASRATPESVSRFKQVFEQRKTMSVADHHCSPGTAHVIDARKLYPMGKPPSFDPPALRQRRSPPRAGSDLDQIVRAFHDSSYCDAANRKLLGRREALGRAWSAFTEANASRWPAKRMAQARHLDFVMRTAIYEGHLGRGCNAYGACERNLIALSIRNRAVERCLGGQGCRSEGDFEGVASAVSQYNIWDEYLTQTSGLTACFLRADLGDREPYAKLQAIYAQSRGDIERILYGGTQDLRAMFDNPPDQLKQLRHYYHPPAMGKCFPNHKWIEYITAAVARRGNAFALIVNSRIHAGERREGGYLFQQAVITEEADADVVTLSNRYPGFVIDGRKVKLEPATLCTPYGLPRSCRFESVGRHRKTPSWLASGQPLQASCRVRARGEDCRSAPKPETTTVGGRCDRLMQPMTGVP